MNKHTDSHLRKWQRYYAATSVGLLVAIVAIGLYAWSISQSLDMITRTQSDEILRLKSDLNRLEHRVDHP